MSLQLVLYFSVCGHEHAHVTYVQVKGQLGGVSALLPPRGFLGSSSGHQAGQKPLYLLVIFPTQDKSQIFIEEKNINSHKTQVHMYKHTTRLGDY